MKETDWRTSYLGENVTLLIGGVEVGSGVFHNSPGVVSVFCRRLNGMPLSNSESHGQLLIAVRGIVVKKGNEDTVFPYKCPGPDDPPRFLKDLFS